MEEQARGREAVDALVKAYIAGEIDTVKGPAEEPDSVGAWRIRSVLLLLDRCFPERLIHEVLWCSEMEARNLIDAIRRQLPDADSVREFLSRGSVDQAIERFKEESSPSLDTEDVKQALNMLEYWTDHWLREYKGKASP